MDTDKQEELSVSLEGVANESKSKPVSKEMDNRFSIIEKRNKTLYSYSNDPEKVAFTEKDNKLIANDNNPALIKNMMEVAENKGWEKITVTGDKEFRRDVWMEAKARGLTVNGYAPTKQDERKLERIMEKQNSIGEDKENAITTDVTREVGQDASEKAPKDEIKETSPILPINDEDKEIRRRELKTAYKTLGKEKAIEKFPELEKVYEVGDSAVAFYQSKGGSEKQEWEFRSKATNKAIDEIASGRTLPDFDVSSYKEIQKQIETKKESEIDYG
ncbi:MAG: LPD7 domain-containing protein [Sedimenticola sp.]